MFKIDEHLVYKKDVCLVKNIKKNTKDIPVYVLEPLNDKSLTITIAKDNENIRDLISKIEMEEIIAKIPDIDPLDIEDKLIENEYKKLLKTNSHEDLIRIIKTTYLRNKERLDNNKKIGERDDNYFKLQQEYFYNGVAVIVGMTYGDAWEYVVDKVSFFKEEQ